MSEEFDVERFVAAYMTVTKSSEEEARAVVEIFLDPDSTRFTQALGEWAAGFDSILTRERAKERDDAEGTDPR